jgi:hypothetical protein
LNIEQEAGNVEFRCSVLLFGAAKIRFSTI